MKSSLEGEDILARDQARRKARRRIWQTGRFPLASNK
jgi:hypothetical protein